MYVCMYVCSLLDYILCPYRAVVDKFLLADKHLYIRVKGVHHSN